MHKILANTLFLGKELIYLPECHSTNDVAFEKFKNKEAREGSVIITDRQTGGRGQRGNSWDSEAGMNLTLSLILTPTFLAAREQFGLNIAIALGIRAALSEYSRGIMVKWPNDIVHQQEGKTCGILIENIVSHRGIELSVVGIGLNINQQVFPFPNTTSMALLAGTILDKNKIFEQVILNIERYYLLLKNKQDQRLMDCYQHHLFRFGMLGQYDDGEIFYGKILGIADDGKLIIQKENGSLRQYAFKEVKFV